MEDPQQPQHVVDPNAPAEPAPGTVLPEEGPAVAEDAPLQGESGEGQKYDGGEIPQTSDVPPSAQEEMDAQKTDDQTGTQNDTQV